jgi:hypothetical protein
MILFENERVRRLYGWLKKGKILPHHNYNIHGFLRQIRLAFSSIFRYDNIGV